MEPWEDSLRDLRLQFTRESATRLDRMVVLLDRLASDPSGETLDELLRQFHGLAGAGTSYGFPQVTKLGIEGEVLCRELVQSHHPPRVADLDNLRRLVEGLHQEFEKSLPRPIEGMSDASHPAPRAVQLLVVDGGEELRHALARPAQQEGISLVNVVTLAEAKTALAEGLPDGLVTEVHLPDGSGYEVVEHLRSLPGGEVPAALLVSASAGFFDKVEAIRCGADAHFERPVDWDALVRRLSVLLERSRTDAARVLSVEDDPAQAAFIRAVLEAAGYHVFICEDPRRFEADLVSTRPDLVLMDILLPGVSGYELARMLRQDERYATLPILFLTTEGQAQARIEAIRAGGDDHLVKPVPPAVLLSTVAARIERARFLKSLLDRDGLTKLLTHTAFIERARALVSQYSRRPDRAAVLALLDLDHFKSVNDRYGHQIGDRVLVGLAALLRRRLRNTDTLGRLGGEEFALLLTELKEDEAARLLNRLLDEFTRMSHRAFDGSTFQVTFSSGFAVLDASMSLEGWVKAADEALYSAKAAGRNRVVSATRPPGQD